MPSPVRKGASAAAIASLIAATSASDASRSRISAEAGPITVARRTTSAPAWAAPGSDDAVPEQPRPTQASPAAGGGPQQGGAAGAGQGGDAPSDDDDDLASSGAVGQPVIESVLGGTVIAINDDPVA